MLPSHLGLLTDDRRIIETCRWLGATSAATARSADELNFFNSERWTALVQKGWIREAAPGCYYLNERIIPRLWRERHPYRYLGLIAGGIGVFALAVRWLGR